MQQWGKVDLARSRSWLQGRCKCAWVISIYLSPKLACPDCLYRGQSPVISSGGLLREDAKAWRHCTRIHVNVQHAEHDVHGFQELAESRRKAAEARKASEAAAARTEQAFCEASPWLNEDRSRNVSCADPGRQALLNFTSAQL